MKNLCEAEILRLNTKVNKRFLIAASVMVLTLIMIEFRIIHAVIGLTIYISIVGVLLNCLQILRFIPKFKELAKTAPIRILTRKNLYSTVRMVGRVFVFPKQRLNQDMKINKANEFIDFFHMFREAITIELIMEIQKLMPSKFQFFEIDIATKRLRFISQETNGPLKKVRRRAIWKCMALIAALNLRSESIHCMLTDFFVLPNFGKTITQANSKYTCHYQDQIKQYRQEFENALMQLGIKL